MNREIKFRIYHKKYQRVLPVENINFTDKTVEFNMPNSFADFWNASFNEVELIQFTGLKDANGKEIWEGDIISVDVLVDKDTTDNLKLPAKEDYVLAVVEFRNGGFYAIIQGDEVEAGCEIEEDCIVLGNIFENPDLIK